MERAPSIPARIALGIVLGLFALIGLLDVFVAGDHLVLGTAYIVPVLVAALFLGPRAVATFAGLAVVLTFASAAARGGAGLTGALFIVRMIIVAVGGAVAVSAAAARSRLEELVRRLELLVLVGDGFGQSDELATGAARLLEALVPAVADGGALDVEAQDGTVTRIATRWSGPDAGHVARIMRERVPGTRLVDQVETNGGVVIADVDDRFLHGMAGGNERDFEFLRGLHIRNALIVPLCVGERRLGALTLVRTATTPRPEFAPRDEQLFNVAGSRAAAALDSARLVAELRRAERELSGILAALAEAVTVQDRHGQTVYANDAAAALIFGGGSAAALVSAAPGAIAARFEITREDGSEVEVADLPGHRLMDGDLEPEPLLTRSVDRDSGVERWLLTKARPIMGADGRPALAVNVIEDVTEVKRAERVSRVLAEAGEILGGSRDLEPTLQEIAALAVPELADWCAADLPGKDGLAHAVAIAHVDPERVMLGRALRDRYPVALDEPGGVSDVLRGGPTLARADIADEELARYAVDTDHLAQLLEIGFRHVVICPMRAARQTVGALTFTRGPGRRGFTRDEVALCEELARRTGIAVEGARLLQARADVADTLQRSMMPAALPEVEGLTLEAFYQAAGEVNEVGGDFYDVFPMGDGWLAVIGDVTGKGAAAAALTSLTRSAMEAVATLTGEAEPALAHLNWLLHRRGELALCSVCCVRVVPREGAAYVACAGHPPPLLIRGGAVAPIGDPGPLLGAFPEAQWREQRFDLAPGDVILLRTDGVTDAVGADGRFGEDRLRDCLEGTGPGDAAGAISRVIDTVHAFQVGPQRDDTAVVAIGLDGAGDDAPPEGGSGFADLFIHERHELDGTPQSVAVGRRVVEKVLSGGVGAEQAADLRLLVSELCANAVRHGGEQPYVLELALAGSRLRLSVEDRGVGFAARRDDPAAELREGGYGLGLVEQIADRWGVERGATTRVWCELRLG